MVWSLLKDLKNSSFWEWWRVFCQYDIYSCFIKLTKYHVQIMLLFVYTTTHKRFVIFTCRYFKLSWNTTALGQSNCRNFSCGSITLETKHENIKTVVRKRKMLAASMVKVIGSEKESEQEHKQNTFCENNTYDISSIKRVTRKCKREPVTCNVCRLSVHKSVTCLYKVGSFFIFNKVYQSLKWLSHFFTFTNFQMLHFISNCYDSSLCLLRSLFLFITNRVVSS